MKISCNWIKELLPTLDASPEEIEARLSSSGFEVEARTRLADALANVVVADVKSVERHPDADNLSVTRVFDGEIERVVVCGAPNVAAGQRVALARVGAKLPNGMSIEPRTIRGVASDGMICSEAELGLSDESDGILVLEVRAKPGKPMATVLGVDDVILEVAVTPNRPDVLSHYGMARELAALFGVRLKSPRVRLRETGRSAGSSVKIEIRDSDRASKYVGRVITGVRVGPSPAWVVERLRALGQRSISNVVDATNLALLELGHPLHAFDLAKLTGSRVVVRTATAGEKLVTIDGVERALVEDDLVIADAEKPIALAGIMGGQDSGVSDTTTDVLLEAALFDPGSVRRSARRHALHTDASHRFERGSDPEAVEFAIDRVAELILELAGGALAKGRVVVKKRVVERPITYVRPKRAERVLGRRVEAKEVRSTLARLGLEPVTEKAAQSAWRKAKVKRPDKERLKGALFFQAPSWRVDLEREEDLIEEVARVAGFESIPTEMPPMVASVWTRGLELDPERRTRERLAHGGFLEAISLAFNSRQQVEALGLDPRGVVEVANPLGEESALMRVSLLPALLRAARHNQDVLPSITDLRLFEIGHVFRWADPAGRLPVETLRLALLMRGHRFPASWANRDEKGRLAPLDAFDLKAAVESVLVEFRISGVSFERADVPWLHPRSSTRMVLAGRDLGHLGELHPDVMPRFGLEGPPLFVADLDLASIAGAEGGHAAYKPLPRHPPARRDLSFFISKDVPSDRVLDAIRNAASDLEAVEVFDVYEGKDPSEPRRSVAVSMTFRATERTLTDAEVERTQAAIIEALSGKLGAEIRSA